MSKGLTQPMPRIAVPISDGQRDALARAARSLASAESRRAKAEADRDRLIVETRAAGVSLRAIADIVGLSPTGVLNIVERASNDAG
jgi:hypothetical protein